MHFASLGGNIDIVKSLLGESVLVSPTVRKGLKCVSARERALIEWAGTSKVLKTPKKEKKSPYTKSIPKSPRNKKKLLSELVPNLDLNNLETSEEEKTVLCDDTSEKQPSRRKNILRSPRGMKKSPRSVSVLDLKKMVRMRQDKSVSGYDTGGKKSPRGKSILKSPRRKGKLPRISMPTIMPTVKMERWNEDETSLIEEESSSLADDDALTKSPSSKGRY